MADSISTALAASTGSPGLLSAFKGHFHGNTKAMAQAVGVTPRTVQRWFTSGKEQRKPSKATRAKMARLVPPKEARVKGKFNFDTPGFAKNPDTRDRDISFALSPEEAALLQEAIASGDNRQAQEIFFEAYGMAAPDVVEGADYSFSY